MMKSIISKALFTLALTGMFSFASYAKKMTYELRIFSIVYNGDTLQTGGDVVKTGILKSHTKRLPIATLNDEQSLHLELWLTMEGAGKDRFTVFQHKYYIYQNESWLLMAVAPRLKFKGRHYDRGHYYYNDPKTGETLDVTYKLIAEPYKKKKKKK